MGQLTSQSGVQQGDPLGPFLFALVLHKVAGAIKEGSQLLYQALYLDDGILAGNKSSICRSPLLACMSTSLNVSCPGDTTSFPSELICPQYVITYSVQTLLPQNIRHHRMIDVAATGPQGAFTLLCFCGSFCRLSYLACSTPTNLVLDAFKLFNNDIHHCFVDCTGFETSDKPWCQAQLGLNRGGLGLCLLFLHSSSTFIASFCSSGVYDSDGIHLTNALDHFNAHVPQSTNCPSFLRSPHLSVRSSYLQKWMTIPRFNLQMCG